jgi:hypothetical protein
VIVMGLYFSVYPRSLHEFKVKISDTIFVIYQLDSYQRWLVHVRFVFDGVNIDDDVFYVGKASDEWIARHFEDDD